MEANMVIGKKEKGFTLIELLIVIVVIGILVTTTRPAYDSFILKSKESALKKNLYIIRDAIDAYSVDHKDKDKLPVYPTTMEDLVKEKYIRYIPENPMTGKIDWKIIPSDSSKNDLYDIKSPVNEVGTNGKPYSEW